MELQLQMCHWTNSHWVKVCMTLINKYVCVSSQSHQ